MSLARIESPAAVAPTTLVSYDGEVDPAVGKLAAQVARRIEAEVVRRGWPVGESLGSEPELRVQYGVSRSVLREAVRLVEHHQVARMRRGPNGGLFVAAPDAGPAARALVIYLEYLGTTVDDLMQARQLLEPLAASLAAQRLTEQGIELLRRTLDADSGDREARSAAEALHVALGELSMNAVLQLFIDVLIRLTSRYAQPSPELSDTEYRKARAEAIRRHAEIAAAVIAGEGGRAEGLLAEYLDGVRSWMLANSRGSSPTGVTAQRDTVAEDPRAKLAEVVAGRLRDDIAASGWSVGEVVGSEADLLARYGISRAVLREAVRLLEYHSVARMRRGPGGGLVVATPDPQASIDTMALYLEFSRVTGGDLLAVREAVELGMVSRVTVRHDDPEVAERLDQAVRLMSEGPADDQDRADAFHTELAALAGNPVLTLFLRILTELWRRHAATARVDAGAEAAAEVEHVHRRITEAVVAGDEGLARHRMRRHLAALTEWWH
jgi:DNA-binding FadR family transcriptional regulator